MTPEQADVFIAAINRLADVAQSIFVIPASDEIAAVFALGVAGPLTLFLVAHMAGSLVNFWRR
ncbi:hypothetical protein [Collimonas antrihumi]|uniref:hypothetical protein n=1 Tax=Collimonas antrihumi TaxID=1940615 RepID=UPI001B8D4D48|nr:hypothetical protein [Collimonas antrihumi]